MNIALTALLILAVVVLLGRRFSGEGKRFQGGWD